MIVQIVLEKGYFLCFPMLIDLAQAIPRQDVPFSSVGIADVGLQLWPHDNHPIAVSLGGVIMSFQQHSVTACSYHQKQEAPKSWTRTCSLL